MEDRDALLRHYREMREGLLAAIHGLTDAQMTDRSIDGWSVKDHLGHLALWDDVRASEVTRISAGHDSAWRMTDEQAEAYNAIAYTGRRELSLVQVGGSWQRRGRDSSTRSRPRPRAGSTRRSTATRASAARTRPST